MKKETFVKLVDTLVGVCKKRDELNADMVAVLQKHRNCIDELSFKDILYDYTLEDTIIDVFELEMGAYVRDRVADYVYEQNGLLPNCSSYPKFDNAEELYDDIIKHQQLCEN